MSLQRKSFAEVLTFSAPGERTFFGSNGLFQAAAAGVPRFDYDPVTLAARGVILEGGRTNQLIKNFALDDANWGKTNTDVAANAGIAPDGTTTMDRVSASAAVTASARDVRRNLSDFSPNQVATLSAFVRATGGNFLNVTLRNRLDAANGCNVEFNIATGAVSFAANNTGTATGALASIENLGSGVYHIRLSGKPDIAGAESTVIFAGRTSSGQNEVAANTALFEMGGLQLITGALPMSLVPTDTMPVTHVADTMQLLGSQFDFYRRDEGTFFVDFWCPAGAAPRPIFTVCNNAPGYGPRHQFAMSASGTISYAMVEDSGAVGVASLGPTALPSDGNVRLALAYRQNDFAISINGALATAAVGTPPQTVNALFVGRDDGVVVAPIRVRALHYFPNRLSNADLQGMTTL